MIGIFLIYFFWKVFSELAVQYNKSKWGFGLLGVATYYGGTFVGGICIGIYDVIAGTNLSDSSNTIVLSLIAMPFGLLSVWGLYKFLENKWGSQRSEEEESLDNELNEFNMEG